MLQGETAHIPGRAKGLDELIAHQILKLIRLDAETVGPKLPAMLHPVGHDLGDRPPGQVGLDVQRSRRVDSQQHQRRIIADAARRAPCSDRARWS